MPQLLLELFSEEIPARMQSRAAADLARGVQKLLQEAGLDAGKARTWVTPRRLGLAIEGVAAGTPELHEERRGPRADAPEKAVEGFLRGAGAGREALEIRDTGKGSYYFLTVDRKGEPTSAVLARGLPALVAGFDWPKSMRWGTGKLRWVRPLHAILCLFDGAPVAFEVEGVRAGAMTRGHRFMAPEPFAVTGVDDYAVRLLAAKVIIDPAERAGRIREKAASLAKDAGLRLVEDEPLVAENAGLVEWPVVLMGAIDPAFMALPREVLSTAMRAHQKYFSVEDAAGLLAPRFVLVANMETPDAGARIVAGNERVLRARLSDAAFFWDQDRKLTLESRVEALADLIFHARLGSVLDKVGRVEALAGSDAVAGAVAAMPGAPPPPEIRRLAGRAARLCKADLMSDMVGEFPELQGTMGGYYARNDGEDAAVAAAVRAHYAPVGPGDACPKAPVAVAVALADKVDSLAAFWAIGEKPTGSRDPYALRRAALGVIRLVLENDLRLPLLPLFEDAAAGVPAQDAEPKAIAADLLAFFADRLKVHLRDQGLRHDVVAAVFALGGQDDLWLLVRRAEAVQRWLGEEAGQSLLAAYRRARSIVEIESKKDDDSCEGAVEAALLADSEEIALHERLVAVENEAGEALAREAFGDAVTAFAGLRAPVDAFFDNVLVNSDDAAQRANRLRLLSRIVASMDRLADLSQIEG
ncbi:MAG: glycine--tRNA ligase subunit beta [Acetobacterales bacterium]